MVATAPAAAGSPPPRVASTRITTIANSPDMKIAVATTAGWNLVGSGWYCMLGVIASSW